jgi:uncharacterized membrane protein YbhN (UPF0104 family)
MAEVIAEPRRAWRRCGVVLRWCGTAEGIAYIALIIDLDDAEHAFGRISPTALAGAIGLVALNVVTGAARWRALLTAYGAGRRPELGSASKLSVRCCSTSGSL